MLFEMCIPILFSISGYTGFVMANKYGSQDGEILFQPQDVITEPGSNITFTCTAYFITSSQIIWLMNGELLNSSIKTGPHTSELSLYNVGKAVTIPKRSWVECIAGEYSNGSPLDVGYKPLPQKIECLMLNIDVLHCRWSDNISKNVNGSHDEWIHTTKYYARFEEDDYPSVRTFNCSHGYTHLRYCATEKQNYAAYWISKFVIRIKVDSINRMGRSTSMIEFHPTNHVVLSPPSLRIENITNGNNMEAILRIVGTLPSRSFAILRRHCGVKLQVQYVVLPRDTPVYSLQSRIDHQNMVYNVTRLQQFWQKWRIFGNKSDMVYEKNEDDFFNCVTVTNHSSEVYLRNLPSNRVLLIRARFKVDRNLTKSDRCNGIWSLYGDIIVARSELLAPHSQFGSTFLYFKDQAEMIVSERCCEFYCTSGMMLWQQNDSNLNDEAHHVVKIEGNRYHPVRYVKGDFNATSVCLPANISLHNRRITVYKENRKGVSKASRFMVSSASQPCGVHIFRIKVLRISLNSLHFQVKWFFGNSQNKCIESKDVVKVKIYKFILNYKHITLDIIQISIFHWQANCINYRQAHPTQSEYNDIPEHPLMNTAVIEIEGHSNMRNKSKHLLEDNEIGFETRNLSDGLVISSLLFQEHAAYRFAFALSLVKPDNVDQYPATVHPSLFYFNLKRPSSPDYIIASAVTDSSVRICWSPADQSAEGGPVIRYLIYYTKNMDCISDSSQGNLCKSLHDNCPRNDVSKIHVDLSDKIPVGNNSTGWFEESAQNRSLSIVLSHLQPDTAYFIGVVTQNQMGESDCPKFILKKTLPRKTDKAFYIVMIILALSTATVIAIYCKRRKIRNLLHPLVPHPVLSCALLKDLQQGDVAGENNVSEKVDIVTDSLILVGDYLQTSSNPMFTSNISTVPDGFVDATGRNTSNQDLIKFQNREDEIDSLLSTEPCCSSRSFSEHCTREIKESDESGNISDEDMLFYAPLEVAMLKPRIPTNI